MARKTVVESQCDKCHKETITPLKAERVRGLYDLPEGWVHVQANSRTAQIFALDLCDECKTVVEEAAGSFRG